MIWSENIGKRGKSRCLRCLQSDKNNPKKPNPEPFGELVKSMNDFFNEKPVRGFLQSIDDFFKTPFPQWTGFHVETS